MLARQIALTPREVVKKADLAFVDKEPQFAGLGEIRLGRQQGYSANLWQLPAAHHAAGPCQGRDRNGQQGATQTVPHGVHARAARVKGRHGAQGL